jgi:hypothetical protein
MKLTQYLNEKVTYDQVVSLNKGREGKPIINVKGKEAPGTVYLGGATFIQKGSNYYTIIEYDIAGDKNEITLTSKQLNLLKKAKI